MRSTARLQDPKVEIFVLAKQEVALIDLFTVGDRKKSFTLTRTSNNNNKNKNN